MIALQLLRFAVNLGVTMLLARLLTPEDFGIYGMALTVVGLLLLFRDGGVESAMLHHGPLDERELASLASLNALYGLALAGICALLAPLLAAFFGEPRLEGAVLLLSVCFVGYGLDVQPGAILLREHRFRTHAWVDFGSLVTGLLVALVLAVRGAGYWSLFGMEVTVCLAMLVGHWRAAGWHPRFGRDLARTANFIRFGRDVSIIRALGHGANQIDNLLVGLSLGPAALAFYSKAFKLINMPQEGINWPLTRLAIPTLSRLREQPAEYAAVFRRLNFLCAALGLPWAAFFIVSAEPVVGVVYGDQWAASIPLLQLLGLMGLLNTVQLASNWVFVSTGTVGRQVKWEIGHFLFLGVAYLIGLQWGLMGVAVAASIACALERIPALVYCFRGTPLRLADLGTVMWRPALATAVGVGAVLVLHAQIAGPANRLAMVAIDGVVLGAGYGLGWIAVPGWRNFLTRTLRAGPPVTD